MGRYSAGDNTRWLQKQSRRREPIKRRREQPARLTVTKRFEVLRCRWFPRYCSTYLDSDSPLSGKAARFLLFTVYCLLFASLISCTDNCKNVSPVQLLVSIV